MPLPITILLIIIFSFLTFFIAYFYGSSIFKKKYGVNPYEFRRNNVGKYISEDKNTI